MLTARLRSRFGLLLIIFLLTACTEPPPASVLNLADVTLTNFVGEQELLVAGRPRIRIVNFWATWCAPCREEMPSLQALSAMLDAGHYEVIGVSVDRDLNLVREYMLKYGISFRQLSDPGMALAASRLGVEAYPETFLLDEQGVVVNRVVGSQRWTDPAFIESFLAPARSDD